MIRNIICSLFFITIYLLTIGCYSSKIPVSYYTHTKEYFMKKDSTYIATIEEYFKHLLPDSLKKEKIKYVIIHGESFRGRYVVVNKKDTIDVFYKNKEEHCLLSWYYKLPSNTKKIEIEDVRGRGILRLNIPKKYDYIEIAGSLYWQIVYSDYPIITTCY